MPETALTRPATYVEQERDASLANLFDIFGLDQAWVIDGSDLDESIIGEVEDISSTEAVPDSGELLDTLRFEVVHGGLEGWHSLFWSMVREPCSKLSNYTNTSTCKSASEWQMEDFGSGYRACRHLHLPCLTPSIPGR